MGTCCPICYRSGSGNGNPNGTIITKKKGNTLNKNNEDVVQLQKRFCKLFERYIRIKQDGHGSDSDGVSETKMQLEFLLQEITEFGLVTCEDCVKVLESFCDIYSQIKRLELLLNWNVWTLKNVMEGSQEAPARVEYLLGCAGLLDGDKGVTNEMIDTLNLVKTSLIQTCSQKLSGSLPRILIPRWKCPIEGKKEQITERLSKPTKILEPCTNHGKDMFLKSPSTETRSHASIIKAKDRTPLISGTGSSHDNTNVGHEYMDDDRFSDLPDPVGLEEVENFQDLVENALNASAPPTETSSRNKTSNLLPATINGSLTRTAHGVPMSNAEDNCPVEINNDVLQTNATLGPITENDGTSVSIPVTKLEVIEEVEPASKLEVDLGEPTDDLDIDMEAENPPTIILEAEDAALTRRPKARKLINNPPSNATENIGKRLRTRHSCSKCHMTFSSLEKLVCHEKSHESNDALTNYDNSSSASNSPKHDDSDAMSWTSSLSDGGDDEDLSDQQMQDSDSEPTSMSTEITEHEVNLNTSDSKLELSNIQATVPPVSRYQSTTKKLSRAKVQKKRKLKTEKSLSGRKPEGTKLYRDLRYKCPDCDRLFLNMWTLLIHRKKSKNCSLSYDPKTSIKVEVLAPKNTSSVFAIVDLPQEVVTCELCRIALCSDDDLTEHKKLHGTFKCNFCQAEFEYAKCIPLHELTHFQEKQTPSIKQCPRCDFNGGPDLYAQHHLKSHLNLTLNEPSCAICKTTTMHASIRKDHFPDHPKRYHDLSAVTNPKEIYRCTYGDCNAYFLIARHLREHLLHRHNINEGRQSVRKVFHCKDCDKRYYSRYMLRQHRMKKHVKSDKVIPCSISSCPMVFENEKELKRHLHNHAFNSTKSPCQKCARMISLGGMVAHLQKHERMDKIESGELPPPEKPSSVCEKCGKKFRLPDQLKVHYLSHTGPESWEFSCSVCSKKCMTKQKLEEHLRTHSQDKPFICGICGVKYAHRHNLRIHVNNKHGDVVQDIPRKFVKTDKSPSKKGVKRKRDETKSTNTKTDDGGDDDDDDE